MLLALLILPLPDQYRKYVISFIDTVIFAKSATPPPPTCPSAELSAAAVQGARAGG